MAVLTFLSDYGPDDDFVGVCHGVIAGMAPDVRVIDITHGVARHDVRSGALVLRRGRPHQPPRWPAVVRWRRWASRWIRPAWSRPSCREPGPPPGTGC